MRSIYIEEWQCRGKLGLVFYRGIFEFSKVFFPQRKSPRVQREGMDGNVVMILSPTARYMIRIGCGRCLAARKLQGSTGEAEESVDLSLD